MDLEKLIKKYNINTNIVKIETIKKGVNVEYEHGTNAKIMNVTDDILEKTFKIAMAHIQEFPDYYERLEKMENEAIEYWKSRVLPQMYNSSNVSHKIKGFVDINLTEGDQKIMELIEKYDINTDIVPLSVVKRGMKIEYEHGTQGRTMNLTNDDPEMTFKIAMAHVQKYVDYYDRLENLEKEADNYYNNILKVKPYIYNFNLNTIQGFWDVVVKTNNYFENPEAKISFEILNNIIIENINNKGLSYISSAIIDQNFRFSLNNIKYAIEYADFNGKWLIITSKEVNNKYANTFYFLVKDRKYSKDKIKKIMLDAKLNLNVVYI